MLISLTSLPSRIYERIFFGIILYSGLAILTFYFYQILQKYLPPELEDLIGLHRTNSSLIFRLKEHVMIFFAYYFCYYYMDNWTDTEIDPNLNPKVKAVPLDAPTPDGAHQLTRQRKTINKIFQFNNKNDVDCLTRFLIVNIAWAHYCTVLSIIFLPPLNILSFAYLIKLFVMVTLAIIYPGKIFQSKFLWWLLSLYNYYSGTILCMRYIFDLKGNYVIDLVQRYSGPISPTDLGISDNRWTTSVLLTNAVLYMLIHFHLQIFRNKQLILTLAHNKESEKKKVPYTRFKNFVYAARIFLKQLKILTTPYIFISFIFCVALYMSNV